MGVRKRIFFLSGFSLAIISSAVMANHFSYAPHSLAPSGGSTSDNPSFEVREDKDFSLSPLLCIPSPSATILNRMNQNNDRAGSRSCDSDWVQRVQLSGGMNIDWFKFGNTNSRFMGVNYQRFSLNDVYLNLAAEVNPWTHAFASLSYDTTTIEDNNRMRSFSGGRDISFFDAYAKEYSSAYSDNASGGEAHALRWEQAYVRFGNLAELPVFLQVGKQFQDFSRYPLHPITRSLTQSLSEILASSAKLGMILPNGVNGSVAIFDDLLIQAKNPDKKNNPLNYSVAVGYHQQNELWGGQMGVSWVRNLIAANDVSYQVAQNYFLSQVLSQKNPLCMNCYSRQVSGLALYGDFHGGPWKLSASYTRALRRFTTADLSQYLFFAIEPKARGAKPWAMGIQLGYHLASATTTNGLSPSQQVYIGYQASRETLPLGLPKYRWVLGYTVSPAKNTEFALEWDRDKDFSVNLDGQKLGGKRYHLVTLRSSVKFS